MMVLWHLGVKSFFGCLRFELFPGKGFMTAELFGDLWGDCL